MAVIEIAKILVRRGRESQTGVPQLDSGEFGWAEDTENLFIGKRIVDGASSDQNTRILTERDLNNIFDLIGTLQKNNEEDNVTYYRYRSDAPWIHSSATTVQNKLDQYVTLADYGVLSSSGITPVSYWDESLDNFIDIATTSTINLTLSNSYIDSNEALTQKGIVFVVSINVLTYVNTDFSPPIITVGNESDYLVASTRYTPLTSVSQGTLNGSGFCKTVIGLIEVPETGMASADLKILWPTLPIENTVVTVDTCVFFNVASTVKNFASGYSTSTTSTGALITPIGPLTASEGSVVLASIIEYCGTVNDGNGPNDISIDSANNQYPFSPSYYSVFNGSGGLSLSTGTNEYGLFYTMAYRSFSTLERETIVGNKDYTPGVELNFTTGVAFVLPGIADYLAANQDITDRLQLAIDDLFANITSQQEARRELIIPAGSFYISKPIDVPSYAIIRGAGVGMTNLYLVNNASTMFRTVGVDTAGVKYYWDAKPGQPGSDLGNQSAAIRPKNIIIENMSLIHMTAASSSTSMISVDNARDVTLKNIEIKNNVGTVNAGLGVEIRGQGGDFSYTRVNDGYTQNVSITDCKFQNLEVAVECTGTVIRPGISNSIFSYLDYGVLFYTIDSLPGPCDGFVTKNRFQNIKREAISVGTNPNDFRSNISSSDNFFGGVGTFDYKEYTTTASQATSVIKFYSPGNKTTNDYFARKALADQGVAFSIDSIVIEGADQGPYVNPTITISGPDLPNGKQAVASLVWNDETQLIESVTMIEKGYGYSTNPTVTITALEVGTVTINPTITLTNDFYYYPYVTGIATIQDLASYSTTIDPLTTATFARFPITGGTQRIDIHYQMVSSSLNRSGDIILSVGFGGSTLIDEIYNFNLDLTSVSTGFITPGPTEDPQVLTFPQFDNDWVNSIPNPPDNYYIVGYGIYDGFAVSINTIDVTNIGGVDYWTISTTDPDFDFTNSSTFFTVGYLDYYEPEITFTTNLMHNYIEFECYNNSTGTSILLEYQANTQLLSLSTSTNV